MTMNTSAVSALGSVTVDDLAKQVKPLSKNAFVAFFQKIWRKWLSVWYEFSAKNPKLSKLFYQLAFFVIFNLSVTVFQYIVTLFLPKLLGLTLAGVDFLWPRALMYNANGQDWYFSLLGYAVVRNGAGKVIIGGGLGYFIAFEIATFLAQVINFPLQRNITFKSHGKVAFQIMWYFIGWVLTSLFCNGINSLWLPLANGALGSVLPPFLTNIIAMVITGLISMTIFFFIFLIIFPDYNAVEKRTRAKLEKLKSSKADPEKIKQVELALLEATQKAKLSNAEKAEAEAITLASSSAMKYFDTVKNSETAKAKLAEAEAKSASDETAKAILEELKTQSNSFVEKIAESFKLATAAIVAKDAAIKDRQKVIKEAENNASLKTSV